MWIEMRYEIYKTGKTRSRLARALWIEIPTMNQHKHGYKVEARESLVD